MAVVPGPGLAALRAARCLSDLCVENLGADAMSVILHGSLAAGDFQPGRSDIDLLIVAARELSDPQLDALTGMVLAAGLGDAAGIDLVVATASVCAAATQKPPLQLLVGRYPGASPALEVVVRAEACADLIPELSMARAFGRVLHGAAPLDVIGPVPGGWIVQRGKYWLNRWLELTGDVENAAFMVLTACRMWHFAATGEHSSKTAAAQWVLARDPSLTAVRQALRQRIGDPRQPIDQAAITTLLRTVLRECSTSTTT